MDKKQSYILLAILCIITIAIRLYFAFSTPYFSDDTSYYYLRQIEEIKEHAIPQFYDPLSFGGRLFIYPPLFQYLFALLTSFGSSWYLLKIIPNLFAASLIVIIFFLVQQLTKNEAIALFTACIAAFIPVYFVETVNALNPTVLSLPLTFLFLFCFYRIQEFRWRTACIFLLSILILLSPSVFLIIAGLLMSLFLQKIYGYQPKREEGELLFFGLLLSLWFYLLLYKRALVEHGIQILWQNIPPQLVDKYYYQITIISSVSHIGIVPLFFGLLVIYYCLFATKAELKNSEEGKLWEEQRKKIFPIIGSVFVTTFLLWTKAIEWSLGLMYLSVFLVLLSGYGYMLFHVYIQKTKIRGWSNLIFSMVFFLFILSSVVPAFSYAQDRIQETITPKEVVSLRFLPEMVLQDEIVLSLVDDGHYIEYFGARKAVADSNFLQIKDGRQRVDDIQTIFTTQSKVVATKIMNKYHAEYIYISPTAKKLYGIEYLPYEDNDCFQLIYVGDVRLYKSTCAEEEAEP